ncbi:MAG: hypothetical protein AB7T10_02510 [bacterium]
MKRIILIFIIIPLFIFPDETSLLDSYREGYDEGRIFAEKNTPHFKSFGWKDGCECIPVLLTDAIAGPLLAAAVVVLTAAAMGKSDDDAISFIPEMAALLTAEIFVMRGMNCLFGKTRAVDEYDIIKMKNDFPNEAYKEGFLDGAKSIYNRKFRF